MPPGYIVHYIEMTRYPQATVSQLDLPNLLRWEMERRLALVYLGNSHNSSQVHEMVIRGLENAGIHCRQLEDLRKTPLRPGRRCSPGILLHLALP